jgi:cytochrome c biogenesis protein CcmG, thiol:disulfide interchange protein DsbE
MKKHAILGMVAAAALAVLIVAVGELRARHVSASERAASTYVSASAAATASAATTASKPAGSAEASASAPAASASAPAGSVAVNDQSGSGDASDESMSKIRFVRNPAPMPPFLVNDLTGQVISSAALHGKVVILNFWATWCPPCQEEIPEMIHLANKYKDRLLVIGISMDDASPQEVAQFARHAGMNYPIVMGSGALSQEYGGVPALPTSFVVDTNGGVVQKHIGLYPEEVYDNEIRALLGMPVNAAIETFEDTGQIFLKNAIHATDLPGVDFSGLSPDQKKLALKEMNSRSCTCGCKLTIAQCRINDSACDTSKALANKIVADIKAGRNPDAPAAPEAPSIPDATPAPAGPAASHGGN